MDMELQIPAPFPNAKITNIYRTMSSLIVMRLTADVPPPNELVDGGFLVLGRGGRNAAMSTARGQAGLKPQASIVYH